MRPLFVRPKQVATASPTSDLRSNNDLNEAKRLNGLNDLNEFIYFGCGPSNMIATITISTERPMEAPNCRVARLGLAPCRFGGSDCRCRVVPNN
jgi:hypothetical protein